MTKSTPITLDQLKQLPRIFDLQSQNGRQVCLVSDDDETKFVVHERRGDARELLPSEKIGGGVLYGGGDFYLSNHFIIAATRSGKLIKIDIESGEESVVVPPFGSVSSPVVSPDEKWVLFIQSNGEEDALAIAPTDGTAWPQKICDTYDFYAQPTWHPDGRRIAWVSWNNDSMPWSKSFLVVAEIEIEKEGGACSSQLRVVTKKLLYDLDNTSVQQPLFSTDGSQLAFISDQTGSPHIWVAPFPTDEENGLESLHATYFADEAYRVSADSPLKSCVSEYSTPLWVEGLRHYVWVPGRAELVALRQTNGATEIVKCRTDLPDQPSPTFGNPFLMHNNQIPTFFRQIDLDTDRLHENPVITFLASGPTIPVGAYELDDMIGKFVCLGGAEFGDIDAEELSSAKHVSWSCESGVKLNGIYYPACDPDASDPSAQPQNHRKIKTIISIHGGPTSQSHLEWDSRAQYFATRGYAVLQLNYRGSTGYGRDYMTAMDGQWCVTDLEDILEAKRYLVDSLDADPEEIYVIGGSSGGCTVLNLLADYPHEFAGGIAMYPVCDHKATEETTHKFEKYYNDQLLTKDSYEARSPLYKAEKIVDPLIIFHGVEDKVVTIAQSRETYEKIREKNQNVELVEYEGEGHGFRKNETLDDFYRKVEKFLKKG